MNTGCGEVHKPPKLVRQQTRQQDVRNQPRLVGIATLGSGKGGT